jgi:hypothetical protein
MKKVIKIFSIVLITAVIASVNFISFKGDVKRNFTLNGLITNAAACEERVGGSQILLMVYCSSVYQVWNPQTQCYDTVETSGCADANATC